jgi:tRNA(Ile2) C34 agmatinyltransferase TiaS
MSESVKSVESRGMDEDRPPICPACGVTMVSAALSAREIGDEEWVCVECEETAADGDGRE